MTGNLKTYEPMDLGAQDELANEFDAAGASEFVKVKVGKNVFRFLPKQPGQRSHFKIIHEHFVDDVPGMNGTFRFACPRRMAKERCPECDKGDRMKKSNNPIDRENAKDHYPASRIYSNIVDRKNEDDGPRILTFGKKIREQLDAIAADRVDGGDYTNPTDTGFDIIISRVGTGRYDTEYTVRAARTNSPLTDDPEEMDEWIEQQWQLEDYASTIEPARLLAALRGESYSRAALPEGRSGRSERSGRGRRTAQDDVERGGAPSGVDPDDDLKF